MRWWDLPLGTLLLSKPPWILLAFLPVPKVVCPLWWICISVFLNVHSLKKTVWEVYSPKIDKSSCPLPRSTAGFHKIGLPNRLRRFPSFHQHLHACTRRLLIIELVRIQLKIVVATGKSITVPIVPAKCKWTIRMYILCLGSTLINQLQEQFRG